MASERTQFLNVKPGEWGLALSLLALLAINTTVYQVSSVVATGDFLGAAGAVAVPLLWIIDVVITLIVASAYSTIVDRVPRMALLTWFFIGLAMLYLVLLTLTTYGVSSQVTAGILYILADQQLVMFPLAFWALANDVYTLSETRRLFPLIAAGSAIGSILGSGIAALSASLFREQGGGADRILAVQALIFLFGVVLLQLTFRSREIRARQSTKSEDLKETLEVGMDFFRNLPLFRYLGIAMLLVGIAFTLLEYHFLATVQTTYESDPARITTFYGIYQMVLLLAIWLFQWLITGRVLKNAELKNMFTAMPAVMFAGVMAAATMFFSVPALIGAAVGRGVARLVQRGWDEPVRKAAQNLVPDEKRGRISTFLDSYFYSVATLVTSAVLIVLIQLEAANILAEETFILINLVAAGVAASGALWAALQLRRVYGESLLNWRLSRSRRKSVLDGVTFED